MRVKSIYTRALLLFPKDKKNLDRYLMLLIVFFTITTHTVQVTNNTIAMYVNIPNTSLPAGIRTHERNAS
jgi:hypothetical protein